MGLFQTGSVSLARVQHTPLQKAKVDMLRIHENMDRSPLFASLGHANAQHINIRSPSDLQSESRLRLAGKGTETTELKFEHKRPVHTHPFQLSLHCDESDVKKPLLLSDRSPCEKRGAHRPSGEGTCNHILQVNRHDLEPCRSWCTFPMNALGGSSARGLLDGRG